MRPELRPDFIPLQPPTQLHYIDTDLAYWQCGEHASLCASWLLNYCDPVHIITVFFNHTFNHTVCYVKDWGTFDLTNNRYFPNFRYGQIPSLSEKEYFEAIPLTTWIHPPLHLTNKNRRFYTYKEEDIDYIKINKLSSFKV